MNFNESSRILITCSKHHLIVLSREVTALGFTIVREVPTGVVVEGTLGDTMTLNLHLRTAHRVLFQLKKFYVATPDDLYKSASTLPWEDIIASDGHLSVTSAVATESINNTQFANVKCKDAIVDRIRRKTGSRPDSGAELRGAVVFLYWANRECYLYLDTSGEQLSKRGYRKMPWKAPMRETLAAATILASRWDAASHFVNPMCGSGTLAIEAALIALGKPAGLLRTNFGFMHILGFDDDAWKALRSTARNEARNEARNTVQSAARDAHSAANSTAQTLPFSIIASDASPEAIEAARQNARTAGVEQHIHFEVCDFAATTIPESALSVPSIEHASNPVVMLNPEYGERLGTAEELTATYGRIGDFFKQRCAGIAGMTGYVFTGNLDLAKKVGLRTKRRMEFMNGEIECRLLEYELYTGTKRG
jgi:putative N6-adenine-specific DNA methylase